MTPETHTVFEIFPAQIAFESPCAVHIPHVHYSRVSRLEPDSQERKPTG